MVTGALPCQYQPKQRPLNKHTLNTGTRALVTVRGRSKLHACSEDEKLASRYEMVESRQRRRAEFKDQEQDATAGRHTTCAFGQ